MNDRTYFVAGTDTDVGKTVASAWLVRQLDADYWKPIQSGLDAEGGDTERMCNMAQWSAERCHAPTYTLQEPMSPHASAALENVRIELDAFKLPETDAPMIVEGAGGLMVPLNEQDLLIDLMAQLRLPVILVARSALGTINHTLLSLQAIRRRNLECVGVIMNGPINDSNHNAIEYYGEVPVIAEIPILDEVTPETLDSVRLRQVL